MKSSIVITLLVILVLILTLTAYYPDVSNRQKSEMNNVPQQTVKTVTQNKQTTKQQAGGATKFSHFIGGFNAGHAISTASSLGVRAALDYGYNPVQGDSRGTALKAANMSIIDDMPDKYLRQFASNGNMSALISSMTNHLKAEQNNSQIIAYWVLDDSSKNGNAKAALVQMTNLIHQYTPGKPSICGFNGDITPNGGIIWKDGRADNFSPQGCDMVAPYIYAHDADPHDWTMKKVLAAMFASLQERGWNIATNPLVGIPESFGGTDEFPVPTANDVETQTKAFCQAGATGIIFYDFGTGQNASNNSGIQQGVKAGIADCKAIWESNSGV